MSRMPGFPRPIMFSPSKVRYQKPEARQKGLCCRENRFSLSNPQSYRNVMLRSLGFDAGTKIKPCLGILWERDVRRGLGMRCREDKNHFHPIEFLICRAVEEGLLGAEQREAIRKVVSEIPIE